MTGFAIFIYFFSSFTSNKKTWTHPRLKFLQFLSPTIINIFFQLAKITFKSFVINYILREKVQYIISQKIFGDSNCSSIRFSVIQSVFNIIRQMYNFCVTTEDIHQYFKKLGIYIYIFATIITWRRERSEISEEVCIGWPMCRSVQGRSIESPVVIPTCS